MRKLLESGALGLGTAALAKNPELLSNFGIIPGMIGKEIVRQDEKAEEKKKRRAAAAASAKTAAPAEAVGGMKKGGKVKKYASGGKVTRGDGICKKGHTKGKMI